MSQLWEPCYAVLPWCCGCLLYMYNMSHKCRCCILLDTCTCSLPTLTNIGFKIWSGSPLWFYFDCLLMIYIGAFFALCYIWLLHLHRITSGCYICILHIHLVTSACYICTWLHLVVTSESCYIWLLHLVVTSASCYICTSWDILHFLANCRQLQSPGLCTFRMHLQLWVA